MKIIRQYILFLIGFFIASMGVAFSTKAGLIIPALTSYGNVELK